MMENNEIIEVTTVVVALKLIAELYKQNLITAHTYKEIMEKHGGQ